MIASPWRGTMKASDIMTRKVISVEPDASILHAVHLMLQNRISGLPVIDTTGKLVGILSEGDLLRRQETGTQKQRARWVAFFMSPGRLAEEYVHAAGRKVREIMTPDPRTIVEGTPVEDVVRLMERHRIKRLPVRRDDTVVGIVTRANLVRALASLAVEAKPSALTDSAIRDQLQKELDRQPWAPVALINIVARNGVVQLWGTITDEAQRAALIVAAENIAGVRSVEDHLVWMDPMSGLVFVPPEYQAKVS
jgi:CBS domain-containing protein